MYQQLIEECLELSDSELDDVIAQAEAARNLADARIAAAVSVVSARQSFRDDGHVSLRSYLKATLNCSGSRANRIRRQADLINHHAGVGDTWARGHVGTEQVDVLAKAAMHPRAGDRFAEFAPALLGHAEHLEYSDFDVVVQRFVMLADPDGAFDDQRFREDERNARVSVHGGAIDVNASGGSPIAAAEMSAVFELAVQAEFDKDCVARRDEFGDEALAHPLPRTARQRKFDALHQIFLAWASVPTDAKTPEPLVNIVIDHVTAGNLLAAHGLIDDADLFGVGPDALAEAQHDLLARRCHTSTGTPIHGDEALKALVAGRVRRAVIDADSVVVDMGRTSRLFTGASRDAARMLATTCTHRGCDIPARFCDVDHRREWVGGHGPTNQANAMALCGVHDRWKHANRIRTRRATNSRIYLIRPDGAVIKPASEREPEWAEAPPFDPPKPVAHETAGQPSSPRPPPRPASIAAQMIDLAHTITWTEHIQTRPELTETPDLGWTVMHVTLPPGSPPPVAPGDGS